MQYMLKGKWKFLLLLNYVSLCFWFLVFGIILYMLFEAGKKDYEVASNVIAIGVFGVLAALVNVLYIYILRAYFPSRRLIGRYKVFYIIGLVVLGIIAAIFLIALIFGFFKLFYDYKNSDIAGMFSFLTILFIAAVNTLLVVFQAQLLSYLKRNSEIELKSILASIGNSEKEINE